LLNPDQGNESVIESSMQRLALTKNAVGDEPVSVREIAAVVWRASD
jgi:hypothetical protein